MQTFLNILTAFWATLAEMAPWLILGFVVAGVLSVFFSSAFIERHLGGRGVWPVLKAATLGVPIPVCSCGVIPLGAGLYRQGASRGATSSFLLSTPQTGVDSIAATYALMGPVFAVVRPVVALVNGIFGGVLIDVATRNQGSTSGAGNPGETGSCCSIENTEMACDAADQPAASSCCAESSVDSLGVPLIGASQISAGDEKSTGLPPPSLRPSRGTPMNEGCETESKTLEAASSCCGNHAPAPAESILGKVRRALRYGLVTLPADIAGALIVGVFVAALLTALVPNDALAPYLGGGLLAMLAAVLVGAPLYICATASIPVALGLMAAGASPGAVLAFLIAGPATNAATISVTWNLLGRRTGVLYLVSVVVTAVAAGLLLDLFFTLDALRLPDGVLHAHEHGLSWLDHVWAVAMLALLLPAVFSRLRRRLGPSADQRSCGNEPPEREIHGAISRGVGAEPHRPPRRRSAIKMPT